MIDEVRHITTDVLIIGGGVAGTMAAVGSLRAGVTPMLLTKGTYASGSSSMARGGRSIAIGHSDPADRPELFLEGTPVAVHARSTVLTTGGAPPDSRAERFSAHHHRRRIRDGVARRRRADRHGVHRLSAHHGGSREADGLSTAKRSALFPELPTISESGLPGFEVLQWSGLLAPAGTPRAIVGKYQRDIAMALNLPDVRQKLASQGFEAVGNTPREFSDYIRAEIIKWAKVIQEAGIHAD